MWNETPWMLLIAGILIKLKGIKKKKNTTKIHEQLSIFSKMKGKWVQSWKKKKYYDFFQYTYWIWYFSATKPEWDFTPLLRSYTLLSTHFLQLLHCLKSTHLQQVNVVTKNTSICQNISVQCQHILKERITKV